MYLECSRLQAKRTKSEQKSVSSYEIEIFQRGPARLQGFSVKFSAVAVRFPLQLLHRKTSAVIRLS
jgi:hypothetical protein